MANYKIIGGDQKEYGPATTDELRLWISEGRLSGPSQIQLEGTTEWKPLASFAEFADALKAQAGYGSLAAPTAANAQAWSQQILAQHPRVEIGRCLSLSWTLLKNNFGLLLGASFLVVVISAALQYVPVIGDLLYFLFHGVLLGGLYLIILKRIRGQPASVPETLAGFSLAFGQLLLTGFLSAFLSFLAMCCFIIPGIYLSIAWIFSVPLVIDKRLEFWTAMETSRKVVTHVWFEVFGLVLLAYLPLIIATIIVQMALAIDFLPTFQEIFRSGSMDPEQISKQITQMMMQVQGKTKVLGLIGTVVLLFNLPFAAGALMYAYENLFGTRPAPPS